MLNILKCWGGKIQDKGKSSTFAAGMKKLCHIGLSLLLSLTLLFIGSGINITRCAHTGTVKVMTMFSMDAMGGMGDMNCGMTSSCMSLEHVELSPVDVNVDVNVNFHVFQPLLAILPSLVAEWLVPMENKAEVLFIPEVWKSPPRDYLNFIRVLLI